MQTLCVPRVERELHFFIFNSHVCFHFCEPNKGGLTYKLTINFLDKFIFPETHIAVEKMGGSNPDEKILSYNDVVLRRSDLDILSGPNFLNDRIIEFYFSYLSSCYPSEDVLLVPPSISFWIMNCPVIESLKDFVDPLHLTAKNVVLFPVNDNDNVSQADGGSHWSLLAYERSSNMFVHHDSNRGVNNRPARQLYNAVRGFMYDSDLSSAAKFVECTDSPQQTNGYDCGLYVTAISRAICLWYGDDGNKDKNGDDLWFSAVKEQVTPSVVAEMRNEILGLIKGLMVRK